MYIIWPGNLFLIGEEMVKVVFYTDKEGTPQPAIEVKKAIGAYFSTNVALWRHADKTAGFESGVDWDRLVSEGAVAVVLYSVNDACAFGICQEAGAAGLMIYELSANNNQLLKCLHLKVIGKAIVLEI